MVKKNRLSHKLDSTSTTSHCDVLG